MSNTLKTTLFYFTVFLGIVLLGIHCQKEPDAKMVVAQSQAFMLPPCDSLQNVVWGDTLHVVPKTLTKGIVKKGLYRGKPYWQAMLSSSNFIEPTSFQNVAKTHRIVVADTTEIKYESIFIVSRIK